MKILHAFTGSVATELYSVFAKQYADCGHEVKYITTQSAKNFIGSDFHPLGDSDEWNLYYVDKRVLHIDLRNWADAFIIAPCSMNTLAKLANGICDNLVTCVARAWDFKKPIRIAPSGNTMMWNHPITEEHLSKLRSWNYEIIPPVEKTLFCGEQGIGALADIRDIII